MSRTDETLYAAYHHRVAIDVMARPGFVGKRRVCPFDPAPRGRDSVGRRNDEDPLTDHMISFEPGTGFAHPSVRSPFGPKRG